MLGHQGSIADPEDTFRLSTPPRSPDLGHTLSLYCLRYPIIPRLHAVFPGADLLRFLSIFGGIEIRLPSSPEEVERSHLPDLVRLFGQDCVERLLLEFAEGHLRVPPTEYLIGVVRDVDIYLTMVRAGAARGDVAKRLAGYYSLPTSSILVSFRRVRDSLASRESAG